MSVMEGHNKKACADAIFCPTSYSNYTKETFLLNVWTKTSTETFFLQLIPQYIILRHETLTICKVVKSKISSIICTRYRMFEGYFQIVLHLKLLQCIHQTYPNSAPCFPWNLLRFWIFFIIFFCFICMYVDNNYTYINNYIIIIYILYNTLTSLIYIYIYIYTI